MLNLLLNKTCKVPIFYSDCVLSTGIRLLKPEEEGIGGVAFIRPCRSQKDKVIAEARFITQDGKISRNLFDMRFVCFIAPTLSFRYQTVQCNSSLGLLRLLKDYNVVTVHRNGKLHILRANNEKEVFDTVNLLDRALRIASFCNHCNDYAINCLFNPRQCIKEYSHEMNLDEIDAYEHIIKAIELTYDVFDELYTLSFDSSKKQVCKNQIMESTKEIVLFINETNKQYMPLGYLLLATNYVLNLLIFELELFQKNYEKLNQSPESNVLTNQLDNIKNDVSSALKLLYESKLIVTKDISQIVKDLLSKVDVFKSLQSSITSTKLKVIFLNTHTSLSMLIKSISNLISLLEIS